MPDDDNDDDDYDDEDIFRLTQVCFILKTKYCYLSKRWQQFTQQHTGRHTKCQSSVTCALSRT